MTEKEKARAQAQALKEEATAETEVHVIPPEVGFYSYVASLIENAGDSADLRTKVLQGIQSLLDRERMSRDPYKGLRNRKWSSKRSLASDSSVPDDILDTMDIVQDGDGQFRLRLPDNPAPIITVHLGGSTPRKSTAGTTRRVVR